VDNNEFGGMELTTIPSTPKLFNPDGELTLNPEPWQSFWHRKMKANNKLIAAVKSDKIREVQQCLNTYCAIDEQAEPWYVDEKSGFASIHFAVIAKNMNIVNVLLKHDRNLLRLKAQKSQQTLLHIAVETGNAGMMRVLLNQQA